MSPLTRRFTRLAPLSAILILLVAPSVAVSQQPASSPLTTVTKGRVSFGVPSGWKESPIPGTSDLLGFWSPDGKGLLDSTAFILVGKVATPNPKLDPQEVTILEDKEIAIAGQPARRIVVQFRGGGGGGLPAVAQGKAVAVILKTPGTDGKHYAFIFASAANQWDKLAPVFDRSIASITIDGVGTTTVGTSSLVTVVQYERGIEKPVEGATVLVGRRLSLVGGPSSDIDVVIGDAIFLSGTTGANGTFNPILPPGNYDLIIWKGSHVPQQNFRVTLPGGGKTVTLAVDTGVGSTTRHRFLDSSKVFTMNPPSPNRPVIWGRVTLGTQTSPSPTPPPPAAGEDVTIVVGEHLSFIRKEDPRSPGTFTDVVQGDVIYAEVKTNADGSFAIPMPLGAYSVIIWKQGYIPEERVAISVWPGDYFCKLVKDEQAGSTARHRNLDTTSQNIPRKKLEAKAGIRGVVKTSDRGVRAPAEGAVILVGPDLRFDHPTIPSASDKVIGTRILGQAKTNKDGEYFVPVPPGSYKVIVWKQGCVPQEFDTVTVPPGVHNATLSVDNQAGSSGRHRTLDLGGVPIPPKPAGSPQALFLPLLSLAPASTPADELAPKTVGNVAISVPAEWRRDPDMPADEGLWLVGRAERPDASFAVMRDVSFEGLIELMVNPQRAEIVVSGRAATSFTGVLRNEAGMKVRLVVLTAPEQDGRRIAFLAKAPEAEWASRIAVFDAIFASVKLPAAAPPTVPSPPTVPGPPPEAGLKELARVSRIPDFTGNYEYTAYEDRVVLRDVVSKRVVAFGVAGRGKAIGTTFQPFLGREKAVAGVLGEPVSLELRSFGGAITIQLFEGGTLIQEKESGVVWWNAHARRPRDLRPANEIIRYPRVVIGGAAYSVAVDPTLVVIGDPVVKVSMAVPVGTPGQPVSEAFRKVIDRDKLEGNFGAAVSAEMPLFESPYRVQVFEGGVLIVQPGSDGYWWCMHPKRTRPGPGPSSPPRPVLALPKDPNAVVVRLDYVGGYTPPRKTDAPYLEIRADGRVTLTDPFGKRPTIRARLTPENVLAFVKFAVSENRYFELDTAALDREIKAEVQKRKVPRITDLPTMVLTIRTADTVHEVRCYAPEFYAEQLPNLQSLQRLQAIHKRLTTYMDKLRGDDQPL